MWLCPPQTDADFSGQGIFSVGETKMYAVHTSEAHRARRAVLFVPIMPLGWATVTARSVAAAYPHQRILAQTQRNKPGRTAAQRPTQRNQQQGKAAASRSDLSTNGSCQDGHVSASADSPALHSMPPGGLGRKHNATNKAERRHKGQHNATSKKQKLRSGRLST